VVQNSHKEQSVRRRDFETASLINPEESYMVKDRNIRATNWKTIKELVDKGRYFTIFAPRQMGKTTFFSEFCKELGNDPYYVPVTLSFQTYRKLPVEEFYSEFQDDLFEKILKRLKEVKCERYEEVEELTKNTQLNNHIDFKRFFKKLNGIITQKKIIIFIDEFDGIPEEALKGFLDTLRDMYNAHKLGKEFFIYSIGLVGIRNVAEMTIENVSPFNMADKVRIPLFTLEEVRDLYSQYTEETGQPFTEEASSRIHYETGGQPFMVNRIAQILTNEIKPNTTDPITEEDMEKGLAILLVERNDHFTNIMYKAKKYERKLLEILFKEDIEYNIDEEGQNELEMHGLIKKGEFNLAQISNPIYLKRFLQLYKKRDNSEKKYYFDEQYPTDLFYEKDGLLNMPLILKNFGDYIERIGLKLFKISEHNQEFIGQLQLMCYLDSFIAGGRGDSNIEVVSGNRRIDIKVFYHGRKHIIEMKMWRGQQAHLKAREQLISYLKSENADEGYLVSFDYRLPDEDLPPNTSSEVEIEGKRLYLYQINIRGEESRRTV